MTFGMYNNMNNNWMGLLQSGLGLFSGGSMGGMGMYGGFGNLTGLSGFGNFGNFGSFGSYGGFGGFGGCNSIFTNCFGQPDYDAMAGWGVANALVQTAGMVVGSVQSQKAADKAQRAEDLDRMSELQTEIKSNQTKLTKQSDIAKAKSDEMDIADKEIAKLNQSTKDLETAMNKAKNAYNNREKNDSKEIENLRNEMMTTKNNYEKHMALIKEQEDKKTKAKEAKEAAEAEVKRLTEQIEEDQAELKEIQDRILDRADGKVKHRTSEDDYKKIVDAKGNLIGNDFEISDLRTAVNKFMNAKDDDKYQTAQTFLAMYSKVPAEDIDKTMRAAMEIAQDYVKNHAPSKNTD